MAKINGQKIKVEELTPAQEKPRQTTVNRAAVNVLSNEDEVRTRNSEITVKEIPLNLIKSRSVNNYIISDVEALAASIEKAGQWQEIVVRVDRDSAEEAYICVAGHRRMAAFNYLRNKYLEKYGDENHKMVLLYSYIRARVMTAEEEKMEELVYDDTNSMTRIPTVFEALLRFDLDSIDLEKEEVRDDFIKLVYGEDKLKSYLAGEIKIKLNQTSKLQYLQKLIEQNFPTMNASTGTIKIYYNMIQGSCSELIDAVLAGTIPLREALSFSRQSREEQLKLISAYGTEEFKEVAKATVVKDEEKPEGEQLTYDKSVSKVKGFLKDIKAVDEYLSSLSKKDLTGNQKEIIKQIKKVQKVLSELNEMPVK